MREVANPIKLPVWVLVPSMATVDFVSGTGSRMELRYHNMPTVVKLYLTSGSVVLM